MALFDPRGWLRDRALRRAAKAQAKRARLDFADIDTFVLFVGPTRSGSSIVSQLMNAHPDVIVSRELDAPERVRRGWDRDTIFGGILARDQQLASLDESWIDQDFVTPGSFSGDYQRLRVVGDKVSGLSTASLLEHADLWDRFQDLVGVPVKVVQNVRNPFDNIARIAQGGNEDLATAASDYFDQLVALRILEARCGSERTHVLPIDVLVAVPVLTIGELCSFLMVEAGRDFVDGCVQRLRGSARQARHEVTWPDGLRKNIESSMAAFPQLAPYTFDD
jgi:hypothetical protein